MIRSIRSYVLLVGKLLIQQERTKNKRVVGVAICFMTGTYFGDQSLRTSIRGLYIRYNKALFKRKASDTPAALRPMNDQVHSQPQWTRRLWLHTISSVRRQGGTVFSYFVVTCSPRFTYLLKVVDSSNSRQKAHESTQTLGSNHQGKWARKHDGKPLKLKTHYLNTTHTFLVKYHTKPCLLVHWFSDFSTVRLQFALGCNMFREQCLPDRRERIIKGVCHG